MSTFTYDVVVVGDSLAAVAAAVIASRNGMRPVILARIRNVGGMPVTGGLCLTDLGQQDIFACSAFTSAFFNSTGALYGLSTVEWLSWFSTHNISFWQGTAAGNRYALAQLIAACNPSIDIVPSCRVQAVAKTSGIDAAGAYSLVTGVTVTHGTATDTFVGTYGYVDADYTCMLLRNAGVSLRVGREWSTQHREILAGQQGWAMKYVTYHPLQPDGRLIYPTRGCQNWNGITNGSAWDRYTNPTTPIDGAGDLHVMPMCFRAHVASSTAAGGYSNGVPFAAPGGGAPPLFRPDPYRLLQDRQWFTDENVNDIQATVAGGLTNYWMRRLGGCSIGAHGFGLYQPASYVAEGAILHEVNSTAGFSYNKREASDFFKNATDAYPLASYDEQDQITFRQAMWQIGMWYFCQSFATPVDAGDSPPTDGSYYVPAEMQADIATFSLPVDEFPSGYCYVDPTGQEWPGFPEQIYVREPVRFVGQYVCTQPDCLVQWGAMPIHDQVASANYCIDGHSTDAWARPDGKEIFFAGNIMRTIHATAGDSSSPVLAYPAVGVWPFPMRALLPYRQQCANLVSCVGLSLSRVAAGSARTETFYMDLGAAAGAMLAAAKSAGQFVADVPYSTVLPFLAAFGARTSWGGMTQAWHHSQPSPVTLLVGTDTDGLTGADLDALAVIDPTPPSASLILPFFNGGTGIIVPDQSFATS